MSILITALILASATPSFAAKADSAGFAFDLYRELAKQPGNIFYSPYSLSSALAMTSAGAKGKTQEEMLKTLHFNSDPHKEMALLRQALSSNGNNKPLLSIANRLWGKSGESYEPAFLHLTESDYAAMLAPLNFADDPEGSRSTINGWVEKETHDKIHDLIPAGAINKRTNLILTNAVYFKGKWDNPFKKEATQNKTFHLENGTTEQVPFMHLKDKLSYWENSDFQALRLPYEGNDLAMLIVLPKSGKSLKTLSGKLKPELLDAIRLGIGHFPVEVSLPKFRLEFSSQMQDVLEKLGMKLAFTQNADFSGIRKPVNNDPLFISSVVHKAFVEIDESGTEAAAASAVMMEVGAAYVKPEPPKVFTADHPFLFLIEHIPTDTVLFMGRLVKP